MAKPPGDWVSSEAGSEDPAAELAAQLRELRTRAGSPSFRYLASVTHYSRSALAQVTSGKRLPSEALLRAFVTGCGADPDEWITRLRQAVQADRALAVRTLPGPASRVSARTRKGRIAAAAGGACVLLAAGAFLGALNPFDSGVTKGEDRKVIAKAAGGRATDGSDPVVAGCVRDAQLIDQAPVMLDGRQIGALELIYSARCGAGWARIFLYPGEPDMLGEATVRAADGRLAAFAYPLIRQQPVYTDVITLGAGRCLSASALFRLSARGSATATITCQNPSLRS